jgi:hypothetical protein
MEIRSQVWTMGCAAKNFLIQYLKGTHSHVTKEHPVNLPLFVLCEQLAAVHFCSMLEYYALVSLIIFKHRNLEIPNTIRKSFPARDHILNF